jgi:hypothetical protein
VVLLQKCSDRSVRSGARQPEAVNLEDNQASVREGCDSGLLAGAVTMVWQHGNVMQVNEIGNRDVGAQLPTPSADAAAATIPAVWRPVARRRAAFAEEILRPSGGSTPSRSWPERGDQPFAAPGWHRNDPAKTVTSIPRRAVSKLISLLMGRSRRSNDVRHISGGRPTSVATSVPSKSRIG